MGLNIATQRRDEKAPTHAVFLSGNGPLVAVCARRLTRDEYYRLKSSEARRLPKKKIGDSSIKRSSKTSTIFEMQG